MNKKLAGPDYKKCQFFTKSDLVSHLLDVAGYKGEMGKKFLEPACGDGQILLAAVERYIQKNRSNGLCDDLIRVGLERDFVAYEIDEPTRDNCLSNLNSLAKSFGICNVAWNIIAQDILASELRNKFDFIIGNPPYISYSNLSIENRLFCRQTFESCRKGKFDYSFAFIEFCFNHLDSSGVLCFVVPSAVFKTVAGATLRTIIKPYLTYLENGFSRDHFIAKSLPTISATVFCCRKGNKATTFLFRDISHAKGIRLPLSCLKEKWTIDVDGGTTKGSLVFSDVFDVHSSVATLSNKTFLVSGRYEDKFFVLDDGTRLEKEMVRPAASPSSLAQNLQRHIIFPYVFENGFLTRLSEKDFEERYPLCFRYLEQEKNALISSDKDTSALWFEYGRSQNIAHVEKEKLLLSIMFTNQIKIFLLERGVVPYSGIAVYKKSDNYGLEDAQRILQSDGFAAYVQKVGIKSSGGSWRILPSDVKNYRFEEF